MATATYVYEDCYVNDFLTSRNSDIDDAYQRIIQDMISVMRNFYKDQIIVLTPDRRSINMDYVFNKIKMETQLLGKAQYVFTNGTGIHQRMSDTLVEQQSHQDEQQQKLETLYKRLKKSVTTRIELDLPTEDNIPDGDVTNLRNILKDLNTRKNIPKSLMTNQCYLIGKILLSLKNSEPS